MKSFLIRCIGLIFLLTPVSVCLAKVIDNYYIRALLLICFSAGFCFVKFKGE